LKAGLSYNDQEELIANVVKQSIERFIPSQGIESKLVYRLPIGNLDKKELEGLKSSYYDKQSILSRTKIFTIVSFQNKAGRPEGYVWLSNERTLIEIIHIANDVMLTSFNFMYDDMAIWIGHQLKDYFNLTVELRNPEKTFA
jgi:hypothetical protein